VLRFIAVINCIQGLMMLEGSGRLCKGSSQIRPRQRSSNAPVEEAWVLKHRGVEAVQRNRARVRPKSSGVTPECAGGPPKSTRLAKPAAAHRNHTEHAAFA
jgi:hypothetical protein